MLEGNISLQRIIILKEAPKIPIKNANTKYKKPISLWFLLVNHEMRLLV